MDFGIILVAAPFMLLLGIFLGVAQLFTSFGFFFALPVAILTIGALVLAKYHKNKLSLLLALTAALGQWFGFVSWIASRRSIGTDESTLRWGENFPSAAKAGFPYSSLEIPPSPMGSDIVPLEMWSGVFMNQLIWFSVALVVSVLIVILIKSPSKKPTLLCTLLAFVAVLYNLTLFAFWFD